MVQDAGRRHLARRLPAAWSTPTAAAAGRGFWSLPAATGDVAATHVKWKIDQIPEGLSSPVIVGEYLYRLHNPGVLKCVDLATGERSSTPTRLNGISVSSSPIATPDGTLYFASAGKTFVVQAGPKFELLATNDLGDPTPPPPP